MFQRTLILAFLISLCGGIFTNGLFFIASKRLQFTNIENIYFAILYTLPYIPVSLFSDKISKFLSPRALLISAILLAGLSSLVLALSLNRTTLLIFGPLYNFAQAPQWPVIQAFVAVSDPGRRLSRNVGTFNLSWALGNIPSLALVGLFIDTPHVLLVGVFLINIACAVWVRNQWEKSPSLPSASLAQAGQNVTGLSHKESEHSRAENQMTSWRLRQEWIQRLLVSSRLILPMGYFLLFSLMPLLPGIWSRLGIELGVGAMLSMTWILGRFLIFFVLRNSGRWTGHLSLLVAAATALVCGFYLSLHANSLAEILAGLFLFGVGHGMAYFAAIYYGMSLGAGKISTGGRHEAVIGVGYLMGPLCTLLSTHLPGMRSEFALPLIIAVVLACIALWPVWRSRRHFLMSASSTHQNS